MLCVLLSITFEHTKLGSVTHKIPKFSSYKYVTLCLFAPFKDSYFVMSSVTIEVRLVVVVVVVVVASTIVCNNETDTAASLQCHRPSHFMLVMTEVSLMFLSGIQNHRTTPTKWP